ncbi:MAG: hypothetical protein VYA64_00650 [Pseudomonadota bacterium]|nr:hypothetical protein [Pseudomonadota bacterium]
MQNPSPSVQEKRDHATVLAELKQRVRRLERRPPAADAGGDADLDLGHAAIDRCLGPHGLARGRVHEIVGEGWAEVRDGAAFGFAAALVARLQKRAGTGRVLWIARTAGRHGGRPHGPGLAALGVDPSRLLWLAGGPRADRLWAFEEALRTPGLMAAILEAPSTTADRRATTAARRLQLAAEQGGGHGFILRPEASAHGLGGLVESRWRVTARPGQGTDWRPVWQVELLRARGHRHGVWPVLWDPLNARLTAAPETPRADHRPAARSAARSAATRPGAPGRVAA